jgi:hypothetical protein
VREFLPLEVFERLCNLYRLSIVPVKTHLALLALCGCP